MNLPEPAPAHVASLARVSVWRRPGVLLSMLGMILVLGFLVKDDLESIGHMPWEEDPCGLHDSEQNSWSARFYLRIADLALAGGKSGNAGKEVLLLDIDNQTSPKGLLANSCESRAFLGRLIRYLNQSTSSVWLASAHARAIVIDQYFSPENCADESKTNAFKDAVRESKIPIVLGWATHALPKATSTGCLALNEPLVISDAPKLSYGLTRLASDDLRVPLTWPIAEDQDQPIKAKLEPSAGFTKLTDAPNGTGNRPTSGAYVPSLSLAAALAAHPELANPTSKVGRLVAGHNYPYTTFEPRLANEPDSAQKAGTNQQAALVEENAMKVVCQYEAGDIDYGTVEDDCKKWLSSGGGTDPSLSGKIVVIGNVVPPDMKPFPTGDVPGVYLHANYIQSIVDGRFLLEVPPSITVPAVILLLLVVYLLYWIANCHPWPLLSSTYQAGLWSLGLFACILLVSFVLLLRFSYYIPLWALAGVGSFMAVRFVEAFGHDQSHHFFSYLFGLEHPDRVASQPASETHTLQD